jgi:hypothetical protein
MIKLTVGEPALLLVWLLVNVAVLANLLQEAFEASLKERPMLLAAFLLLMRRLRGGYLGADSDLRNRMRMRTAMRGRSMNQRVWFRKRGERMAPAVAPSRKLRTTSERERNLRRPASWVLGWKDSKRPSTAVRRLPVMKVEL